MGSPRRREEVLHGDFQGVRHAHERMQGQVSASFDLRDPLERGSEAHTELLLGHALAPPQLGDTPADGLANALGIERTHQVTLASGPPRINKVIPLVYGDADVRYKVQATRGIMALTRRVCILLVDDDGALRRMTRRALAHDFDIVDVADGDEAIRALQEQTFDAVVTDLEMPNVDGAGVVAWLELHQPALAKRVVVTTGGASGATRQAWLDRWGGELLLKPYSIADLSHAILRAAGKGEP